MTMKMGTRTWSWLLCGALCGCFQASDPPPNPGGETHFVKCAKTNECDDGLVCYERKCQDQELVLAMMAVGAGNGAGSDAGAPGSLATGGPDTRVWTEMGVAPLVMMVVDTSGSMVRKPSCTCVTAGCTECIPSCDAHELDRWGMTLGAIGGSFESYECERNDRTSFDSYDLGYYLPFHRLTNVVQRNDGILDSYADRVRFGVATFDGMETYFGALPLIHGSEFDPALSESKQGLFSYGEDVTGSPRARPDGSLAGTFQYPNSTEAYRMDTGVRSPYASEGALTFETGLFGETRKLEAIKANLRAVRPFGGTPIAAALDDLNYFFGKDARGPTANEPPNPAPRYVVLVTDGYPDDDYRSYGCDCVAEKNCPPNEDPTKMHCPYPKAREAAAHLRCGWSSARQCGTGPVTKLFVVGLSVDDADVKAALNDIAHSGGSDDAHFASDEADLRAALGDVMDEIVAGP